MTVFSFDFMPKKHNTMKWHFTVTVTVRRSFERLISVQLSTSY